MLETALFLSHWDSSVPVCVPRDVTKDLRDYHRMGVRFLYDCFRKGHKGAILNHEHKMNGPLQISAFLNALSNFITPQSPVLIVHSEDHSSNWHYHLTTHGGYQVATLSTSNYEEILQGKLHRMIMSTVDNVKLLREIKETDFFAVVVDNLDQVATKMVIKQLKSQFNIGLTDRNFLKNPDQKLFWTMLNWSNPGVAGKFAEFCSADDDHLDNLRYPYRAWWQRLTWNFCDSFKPPTDEEEKQYKSLLQRWSRQHSSYHTDLPKADTKRRKRNVTSLSNQKELVSENKYEVVASNSTKKLYSKSAKAIAVKPNSCQPSAAASKDLNSSEETVVYDISGDEDENPILTLIASSRKKPKVCLDAYKGDVEDSKGSSSKNDVLSGFFNETKGDLESSSDDDVLSFRIKPKPASNTQARNKNFDKNELQNSNVDSTSHEALSVLFGNDD